MIDRFIPGGSIGAADEGVGGIISKSNLSCALDTTEVVSHGLTDEERERDAPASRLILELPVRILGESKIRRYVFCHSDIKVSRYRCIVKLGRAGTWVREDP
jgi:hypothetical protein